jgi:hypothetical protein
LNVISGWGERLVGVMLLGIGVWALRKALRVHAHEHEHDGARHLHMHSHSRRVAHDDSEAHHHTHAAFGVGILHGLAGSSHFLGVLPILMFPSRIQALGYFICFVVGTIASMAAFSSFMSFTFRSVRHGTRVYRGLMTCCAASAMVVGCFWLFRGPTPA